MQKKKVIIIEDQYVNRAMLQKILQDTYEVYLAENGQIGLDILKKYGREIACIVLDLVMPVMDGVDFMKIVSEIPEYNNIPILVATAAEDSHKEEECLKLGAWDFIHKPYETTILKIRMQNTIGRSQMKLMEQVKHMAEFDALTNLYNRNKFFTETENMLAESGDVNYYMVRFDIDRFHLINAFFGEQEGNSLLQYIASLLREKMDQKEHVTYGHFEADVFCVCASFTEKELQNLVETVKNALKDYKRDYYIEPSFGVYLIEDKSMSIEKMYVNATAAAKKCKNKYMTYVTFYDASMSEDVVAEQNIMNEAQNALDEQQFVPYLQPKYNLRTRQPYGAEVLVRWIHPEKGLISPGAFIPVFEKNGFIGKLDYYMWEQSCKLLRSWVDRGYDPAPVSVNISRANMYNPRLVEVICELVKKYEISPSLLNLELTESAYMDNPNMIKNTVARLQEKGFLIMMDDFGSGYSSLNTLKEIPVDTLKVDMKFLPTEEVSEKIRGRGERILASVVRMAGWLGLTVIVEGVETAQQLSFLESIGCEYVQGYYFARPMPVADYEKIIHDPTKKSEPSTKTSEEELKSFETIWSSNSQMEDVFHNIMQPVAIYEFVDGIFDPIRVNPAFRQQFGYGQEQNDISHIYHQYISNEGEMEVRYAFEQAVKKRGVTECEYMRLDAQGISKWYKLKVQFMQDIRNGSILFAVFTDITQEKNFETELYRYRAMMDQEVHEKVKFLVVDDSEISRAIIREIFQDKYICLEASNGQEALDILKKDSKEIALVLLDMNMPVMDGETFLAYKNASEDISNIPVVIISAENARDVQINMLKLGVNDYVTKPFVPEIVQQRVKNVLEYNERFRKLLREYADVVK